MVTFNPAFIGYYGSNLTRMKDQLMVGCKSLQFLDPFLYEVIHLKSFGIQSHFALG
jgi:hypothetical protein